MDTGYYSSSRDSFGRNSRTRMLRQIEKEELRTMHGREGLVLQGCGGDLKEWTDGINQMLEQEGILPKGKRLDDVAVFRNEGMTNLLFFFGEEKPDIGKLAAWRLQTRYQFGSTWMSDYVDNRLGGFLHEAVAERPDCALIGEDGNIFNLMGIAARTLRENGMEDKAEEMEKRITGGGCQDYYEALNIIDQYVTITGKEEPEMGGMEMK